MTADEERIAPISVEANRVRSALGRSDLLVRLFDFLLARSLAGAVPKEIEIAQEVFGKTTDFDTAQDSSVRVYIHRLRQKIDQFYAGCSGPRLVIPKGEYRLSIEEGEGQPEIAPDGPEPSPEPPLPPAIPRWRWLGLAGILLLAANVAAWLLVVAFQPADPTRAIAKTFFWKTLAESGRPTFVVAGDYYIFGDAPDQMQVTRLIREFSINSQSDLDQYLMDHPDQRGQLVDVNLHYLPTSMARALRDLLPVVNRAGTTPAGPPWVLAGSELTPDTLKGANVLYVGFLSSLGVLRDPLFQVSGFKIGASYDELVDRASGRHYTSDWGNTADNRTPHRDYAYLASFPGASGNHVLVVAGTRDAAVMQAAEIATDKGQIDQLAAKIDGQTAFEALYEVRTIGNLNLGSTLLVARPLGLGRQWAPNAPDQDFPDQLPDNDQLGGAVGAPVPRPGGQARVTNEKR